VSKRVQELLTKLPHDINPKGLEELRKVKTALVEAEDRTDTLRCACVCVCLLNGAIYIRAGHQLLGSRKQTCRSPLVIAQGTLSPCWSKAI